MTVLRCLSVGFALLCCSVLALAAVPVSVLHEGDRIIVVGDSITGQSAGANGFVGLMKQALGKVHHDTKTTIIPLGGSGQTVGSWIGVEKNSREKNFKLDVPDIDVKTTLDGGADVLVIMLGMNNVLRPDMNNTPEGVANWAKTYHALILALRERTHPRVIALATPTLCTEDELSPKNQLMDALSRALADIAATDNCLLLPVREKFTNMLREGRTYCPDFHITRDFVHPNTAGHLAIATAMLEGLGETDAAGALYAAHAPAIWQTAASKLPALSYIVEPVPSANINTDVQTFKIRYWLTTQVPRPTQTAAQVALRAPEGWTVTPVRIAAASGEFTAAGTLDRLRNVLTLSASLDGNITKAELVISAPWLIGVGNHGLTGWENNAGFVFDPVKGRLPIDTELTKGNGFDQPIPGPTWSRPLTWHRYIASVNYTGGNDAGSVDFAAISWFGTFDVGYGVRWIYSPTTLTVPVTINSHAFAGGYFLSVWLNGINVWESATRTGAAELKLQKGWNALVFKSNHLEWQWQFDIHLTPKADDDLTGLRFSILPHEVAKP